MTVLALKDALRHENAMAIIEVVGGEFRKGSTDSLSVTSLPVSVTKLEAAVTTLAGSA